MSKVWFSPTMIMTCSIGVVVVVPANAGATLVAVKNAVVASASALNCLVAVVMVISGWEMGESG